MDIQIYEFGSFVIQLEKIKDAKLLYLESTSWLRDQEQIAIELYKDWPKIQFDTTHRDVEDMWAERARIGCQLIDKEWAEQLLRGERDEKKARIRGFWDVIRYDDSQTENNLLLKGRLTNRINEFNPLQRLSDSGLIILKPARVLKMPDNADQEDYANFYWIRR